MTDAPHRTPASLQDFEPLLLAELVVLRAAANGSIAKVAYRRPHSPTPDVRLRAEFLAFLARGGGNGTRVVGRRLQIVGACIVGRLDLAGETIPMNLWFYRCTFAAAPVFDSAHVRGSLSFPDCALPGLRADACRIDLDLALNAGCEVDGELHLARARIGRDLDAERLRMRPSARSDAARTLRRQFVGDAMRIGGDLRLDGGVEAVGELRFVGARIGGHLSASGAHLTADLDTQNQRGVALNLDRASVGGSVALDAGFTAAGGVRLAQARIGGDLDCGGAGFDIVGDANWGHCNSALCLDRAQIGGTLTLRRLQGPLQGASLADARVASLADDAGTWGQHHVLDGFVYRRFAAGSPLDAAMRLDWLTRQRAAHLDSEFRPQPWRHAIRVMRRMGADGPARELAIGREHHLRDIGAIGLAARPALRGLMRLGHDAYGLAAGYGHRPLRLAASGVATWLLCGAIYWVAAQQALFAPTAPLIAADVALAACRTECAALPSTMPGFRPLIYSLDTLLPIADLQQRRHWAPARGLPGGERTAPDLVRALAAFERLCGWGLLATALAMGLGLTDRDRRR